MMRPEDIARRLGDIGFERTRRAVAALALSFFVLLYLFLAAMAPEGWGRVMLALSVTYLVAFLGVAADWFWGRWFASGLGWSGMIVAALSLVMIGWTPPLAIYGALHAIAVVMLLGKRMAGLYEAQAGWRERFKMDDLGVARLRKTVTRSAASLPSLIIYALGPKNPDESMLHLVFVLGTAGLAVAGVTALLRLRSWGVLAIGAAASALVVHGGAHHRLPEFLGALPAMNDFSTASLLGGVPGAVSFLALTSTVAGAALLFAIYPFAGPVARYLRRR